MASHKPELARLIEARKRLIDTATGVLLEVRAQGREELNAGEAARIQRMKGDLDDLDYDIEQRRADDARSGIPERYANLGQREGRAVGSAAALAPLRYSDEQVRRAFGAVSRGETAVLTMETRDPGFVGATGLLPPELGPILPVFPRHETRLLERLPGVALDELPAIQYVQVTNVTGSAALVGEGQAKPEITVPAVPKVATARKIAANLGLSWEVYGSGGNGDYPAFAQACQVELLKQVVDVENAQLFAGTGEANSQVNGLTTDPNVLTFDASTVTTQPGPWDALEHGIEALRSGPALATPTLGLAHPSTWSAIRRTTDTIGDYYVAPDPSTSEVNSAWGVDVLVSTAFTPGVFVWVDTTLYGRVVVRESLVTRIGYAGTDFTDNVIRLVSEERLTQTIERPESICVIKNLPIAAATEAPAKPTGRK